MKKGRADQKFQLLRAQEQGLELVLVCPTFLDDLTHQVAYDLKIKNVLLANGTLLIGAKDLAEILRKVFLPSLIARLWVWAVNNAIQCYAFSETTLIVSPNLDFKKLASHNRFRVIVAQTWPETSEDFFSLVLMSADFSIQNQWQQALTKIFTKQVTFLRHNEHLIVNPISSDFKHALDVFCEYYTIDVQTSMFLAHNQTLLDTFQIFTYRYVLDNVLPTIKHHARFYGADVSQDGLSEVCHDFLFRQGVR